MSILKAEFERAAGFGTVNATAVTDQSLDELEIRREREQDQYRQRAEDDRDRKRRREETKDIGDDVSDLQAKIEQRANELRNRIEVARAETIEKILHHERELARINGELDCLRANAIILADGRRAYVTDDGGYVAEDGAVLTDEDLEGAQLPQSAPTQYEDLQDKQAERSATQDKLDDRRERLDRIDEIETRLDGDDDLTMDDLDALEDDFDNVLAETEPTEVNSTSSSTPSTSSTAEPVYSAPSV